MGFFSRQSTTYVSSVVYPLGEDGEGRADVVKYSVLNAVLQGRPVGESITQGLLRGQGIALRNAFRYARDHYADGLPTSNVRYNYQPDLAPLQDVLQGEHLGATVKMVTTFIGAADFTWWADEYLAERYGYDRFLGTFESPPVGVEPTANVVYNLDHDGTVYIFLMNDDGFTTQLSFRPRLFTFQDYIHCAYRLERLFENGVTVSTRPAEVGEVTHTSYASETVNRTGEIQVLTTETAIVVSGSVATVTVTKTTRVTTRIQYFFYRLGKGTYPLLEAMYHTEDLAAPYFPSIPLRVDNVDWTDEAHQDSDLYKTSKKLLTKIGLDLDDLAEKVNTNDNIDEIDYCFVAFGVQLNTKSPEGKAYLYRFFDYLRTHTSTAPSDFYIWKDQYDAQFPEGPVEENLPTTGVPVAPTNKIEIYSPTNRENNHDVKLEWHAIETTVFSGEVEPGAKIGTVTIGLDGGEQLADYLNDMVMDMSRLVLRKQIDENTYEQMTVIGLTYENRIYQDKSVIVTAYQAMTDPDEEGFLVPMHQAILQGMPMVQMTNLSYQCAFLVFNCYKIVKQKWYQTRLFQLIIIIIAIIIIVVTWGAATPAAAGAVSAAMVAAGVTSILLAHIIAATIYVLASMILANILLSVSTELFGEKWGAIIGTVVSIMAMNYANTGSLLGTAAGATSTSLINAQTIMQATSALANVYLQSKLTGINKELDQLTEDYNEGMAKIDELTEANLSTNLDAIDITGFTNATWQNLYEPAGDFLSRTLLVGSDICTITHGLVENFTEVGLRLPTHG